MVTETVEINVSALDYERESRIIRNALSELEALVHGKDEFFIGDPDFTFGWHFFTVSVSRGFIVRVVNLMGNEFLTVKGKSFENKFLNWLTARLQQRGADVHLHLKAEMETSKYGLF